MSLLLYDPSKRPSFAPRPEAPGWVGEVALMLKTGWTERQLREDNTIVRLRQIEEYMTAEGKANRARDVQLPNPLPDSKAM